MKFKKKYNIHYKFTNLHLQITHATSNTKQIFLIISQVQNVIDSHLISQ